MRGLFSSAMAQVVTSPLPHITDTGPGKVQAILSVVFGLTGAISFLVITIAGFRYVISRGDPGAVAKAKNTIIYAAVGMIISVSAFSLVAFVLKNV